jgi:hypothetical protein
MQHGPYIAEFEKALRKKHWFALSQHSLSQLVARVDFSKLRETSEPDRFALYAVLFESFKDQIPAIENEIEILGEDDAKEIVNVEHGPYVAEFENVLRKHSFAISQHSLSRLIAHVDFSKLREASEPDRFAVYEALVESIKHQSRGIENGLQILGENDAEEIVNAMKEKARQRLFASSRIRDIWCNIFIGGCP